VPIVTFHGTADPFLSWEGGTGPAAAKLPVSAASADALGGFVFGPVVAPTVAWAQRDGCEGRGVPVRITPHVTRTDFDRCRGGADVVLYTEEGAGHTWPGSKAMDAVVSVTGPVNHEISATALLWKFFVAHPLSTR
jgi:polyhydroxybutyrate depolymerase